MLRKGGLIYRTNYETDEMGNESYDESDSKFNKFLEGKLINGRYRNLKLSEWGDADTYDVRMKYNELLKKQQYDDIKRELGGDKYNTLNTNDEMKNSQLKYENKEIKEEKVKNKIVKVKDEIVKVKDEIVKVKKSRKVTNSVKKQVAGKQYNKCANNPNIKIIGLGDYKCPLWQNKNDDIKGCFDESGYEIDHIIEHSLTQNDNIDNLQALCKLCHTVKTNNFNRKSKS